MQDFFDSEHLGYIVDQGALDAHLGLLHHAKLWQHADSFNIHAQRP